MKKTGVRILDLENGDLPAKTIRAARGLREKLSMSATFQLSEREKEVTDLLLQGKSNKQIALELGISASTVEFHLKNIYRKLHVSSRTEAALALWKSTGAAGASELGESIVDRIGEGAENGIQPISTRRIPMNRMFTIISACLLAITLIVVLALANQPAQVTGDAPTALIQSTPANTFPAPTEQGENPITETTAPTSGDFEYTVDPGDTCEVIAKNFNIPVETLLAKNNLSPSCELAGGQKLIIPFYPTPVHLFAESNTPPAIFLGEWVNSDPSSTNMAKVIILSIDGITNINMFGVCQPTDCDYLGYQPTPTVDFNYDANTQILNVMWIFDFQTLTQELTITSDGRLKVVTQNHYLDNSSRSDYQTVEYFTRH